MEIPTKSPEVLVIDYGSQYTTLIPKKIREVRPDLEIQVRPCTEAGMDGASPSYVILSGGPHSVNDPGAPGIPDWLPKTDIPVLGICYGAQLIAKEFGGKVQNGENSGENLGTREFGMVNLSIMHDCKIFHGFPKGGTLALMSHRDRITEIPENSLDVIAFSKGCPHAAFAHRRKAIYGLQFHPEVVHTPGGAAMFRNFLDSG